MNFERNVKQKSGRSWDWIVTGHYQHLGQLDDAVLPVCYIHGWNVTRRITANTLRGHVFRPESGSAALEISRHIRWVVSTTEGLQLRGMRAVYGQCWACRRGVRTFRRHIRLHKDRIPRHRHPRSRGCRRGCPWRGMWSFCNCMCRRNVRSPSSRALAGWTLCQPPTVWPDARSIHAAFIVREVVDVALSVVHSRDFCARLTGRRQPGRQHSLSIPDYSIMYDFMQCNESFFQERFVNIAVNWNEQLVKIQG